MRIFLIRRVFELLQYCQLYIFKPYTTLHMPHMICRMRSSENQYQEILIVKLEKDLEHRGRGSISLITSSKLYEWKSNSTNSYCMTYNWSQDHFWTNCYDLIWTLVFWPQTSFHSLFESLWNLLLKLMWALKIGHWKPRWIIGNQIDFLQD